METFRCPTCIGVLPDAHVRRCAACGQALRRRHPRVLGDEHRIGARSLPIDRWMLDRLQGEPRRRRTRSAPEVPWHGRFVPSPRSAEPDLVLPPVVEPPAATAVPVAEPPVAPMPAAAVEATLIDTPVVDTPIVDAPFVDSGVEAEAVTPAAITARDLDLFVAPTPAPVVEPPAPTVEPPTPAAVAPVVVPPRAEPVAPAPLATPPIAQPVAQPIAAPVTPPAPPFPTPRPIVADEELDPEVRALVDELYEQARAELSGIDPRPATSALDDASPVTEAPTATPSLGPSTAPDANEPTPRPNGGGWVPAFVADDQKPDPRER